MNDSRWTAVPELGQLYVEKVLVTFDVPELFVCRDGEGKRYLAVFEDDGDYQYLLAEVSCALLHKMLRQELPIDQVFRRGLHRRAYRLKSTGPEGALQAEAVGAEALRPEELPDAGTLFSLHSRELDAYREEIELEYIQEQIAALTRKPMGSVSVPYFVAPKEWTAAKSFPISGKKGVVLAHSSRECGRYFVRQTFIMPRQGGSDEEESVPVYGSGLNKADILAESRV